MSFSISISAATPDKLEKYLAAIKDVDAQEILTPDERKPEPQQQAPVNPTTQPPAGMFFPGSAPLNPQPPQQLLQQYQQQYQQPPQYQAPQIGIREPWQQQQLLQQYQQQYQQPPQYQQPQQPQQPQQQPPAGAPTVAPDYTHEQLGRAVAAFADKAKDNMAKAQACLQAQGVQAVQQLDTPAKRGAFAVALRQIGVQI